METIFGGESIDTNNEEQPISDESKPINEEKSDNNKNSEKQVSEESNESSEQQQISEETNERIIALNDNDIGAQWNPTHLNKAQINVINYTLKRGSLHIPYLLKFKFNVDDSYKQTGLKKATTEAAVMSMSKKGIDALSRVYIYGFNELSNQFHRIYCNQNYLISKEIRYYDIGQVVYNILSEGQNLYTNNKSRAELRNEIESKRTLNKPDRDAQDAKSLKMSDIDFILSKIHNIPVSIKPHDLEDIKRINTLSIFAPFIAHVLRNGIFTFFAKHGSNVELSKHLPYAVKHVHKIVQVPKDLQDKFNKYPKYFNELTKILKYNESTGFYTYTQEGVELPIICVHDYMYLSGVPLAEISIKCYLDGQCKYCGAEMNAYHEVAKQELPVKVYDLIYKFMSCLNENVDQSLMMFGIFDLLYNSVKKNVDSANPTNYDESVVAFSALYLYALYLNTREEIHYSITKINKFLDSAKKYWTEIGWSSRVVEQSINSPMFEDMRSNKNVVNILKQFIFTNEITFLDVLPLSVLFDAVINPADIKDLKATTTTQKLFLEGKMKSFNEQFNKMLLKLWTVSQTKPKIDKYPKSDYSMTINDIKVSKTTTGERFFNECCLNYCPVNMTHDWKGNECKYCGLKKDKSNVKQIFNKYLEIINNSYLQEPRILNSKKLKLEPLYSMAEIQKINPADLYEKYIPINAYALKQAIDKQITELNNFEEIQKLISTILSINEQDIKKDVNVVKQCLGFIVANKLQKPEQLVCELQNIYFKIENIDWLTI